MTTMRQKRVAEQIQKVISERLLRGLRDPLPGFVTIRDVDVTRDFSRAKVYFSVIGTDADRAGAQQVLDQHRGFFRSEVGRQVRLRLTPEIVFVEDRSGERAARIHQLLNESARGPVASSDADTDDGDDDEEE